MQRYVKHKTILRDLVLFAEFDFDSRRRVRKPSFQLKHARCEQIRH